jgi:predicted metal-binding protein
MKQLKPYLQTALKRELSHAVVVETSKVFTEPWVRMKCQFGCFMYGKRLCCPPRTPTTEEMRKILDSYKYGILLHRHIQKGYKYVNEFNEIIVDLERTIFLDGHYKTWAVGSGPCTICKECNITGTCLHPDKARPSMESCGIDVYRTAGENNLPIKVVKDHSQDRDIFGLILVE